MTPLSDAATTIEPDTAEAFAAALQRAAADHRSVLVRGAGTKIEWGRPAGRIDVVLSTARLNRVLGHQHGDLTATVEAGATLADVNEALAQRGQCLPLDPPHAERATIGGILATNDSGPLRHRYGAPRDLVLGVQLALTDGSVARAGGQVVKNVAGYDLSKLIAGSFGSLAGIASATFKLVPLPAASKSLVVTAVDHGAAASIVRAVMASQLEPIAFEVHLQGTQRAHRTQSAQGAHRILIRFASVPAAVDAQVRQAEQFAAVSGCAAETVDGDAERTIWREHDERFWSSPGAIVRANWLPARLGDVLALTSAIDGELVGRAALGAGLIRIAADIDAQASAVVRLRESRIVSHVVLVRGVDELKARVDVWGALGDRVQIYAALKQAFDPEGILNAGRGPL